MSGKYSSLPHLCTPRNRGVGRWGWVGGGQGGSSEQSEESARARVSGSEASMEVPPGALSPPTTHGMHLAPPRLRERQRSCHLQLTRSRRLRAQTP